MEIDEKKDVKKAKLLGSFLFFTQYFFEKRKGCKFEISHPLSQESHHIQICRKLTKTMRSNDGAREIIAIPPRYGKTELAIHWIAWCMARYPKSNFLYVSYSHSLAKKQTQTVRQIMSMPEYVELFGVRISKESSAKDNFETTVGGSVYAAGSGGTITGRGAGIQNSKTFGGAIVIDDIHKPSEVTSDVQRQSILDWYLNTLQSRVNGPNTPIVFIGQFLHEDDLAANLLSGYDGFHWKSLILPALNNLNQALHPAIHARSRLLVMKERMPYEFSAQYMQAPLPAGGGLFKPEWFVLMDLTPKILTTFLTVDTAETEKTYNDATVFSFWGIYKIQNEQGIDLDMYGLHWLDCYECWVEPKDLTSEFLNFYAECMRFSVKPSLAAIEKKSTGTTLVSVLKDVQGLRVLEIERSKKSGSKTDRFLRIQEYVASKQVSITRISRHADMVITHMKKITANNSHRNDDIADTCADAVQLALIDKVIPILHTGGNPSDRVLSTMALAFNKRLRAGTSGWHPQT